MPVNRRSSASMAIAAELAGRFQADMLSIWGQTDGPSAKARQVSAPPARCWQIPPVAPRQDGQGRSRIPDVDYICVGRWYCDLDQA
jgi:hypothetical protein